MKLVIDIDEDVFTRLFDNGIEDYAIANDDLFAIAKSIRTCTPLPKGHGRIIDENKINKVYVYTDEAIANNIKAISTIITGTDAPTIIEADKEK